MQHIVIAVLVVALVGGGGWYALENSSGDEVAEVSEEMNTADDTTETVSESDSPDTLSGSGTFLSLLGIGDSIRCEFSSDIDGTTSNGVFYTDGAQYRVDATSVTNEGTFASNVIDDGVYTYVWGGAAEQQMAIKMSKEAMPEGDMGAEPSSPDSPASFDVEQEVSYECDRWSVDSTVFLPPSDIEFMDMSAMMQASMQGMLEGFTVPAGW